MTLFGFPEPIFTFISDYHCIPSDAKEKSTRGILSEMKLKIGSENPNIVILSAYIVIQPFFSTHETPFVISSLSRAPSMSYNIFSTKTKAQQA